MVGSIESFPGPRTASTIINWPFVARSSLSEKPQESKSFNRVVGASLQPRRGTLAGGEDMAGTGCLGEEDAGDAKGMGRDGKTWWVIWVEPRLLMVGEPGWVCGKMRDERIVAFPSSRGSRLTEMMG